MLTIRERPPLRLSVNVETPSGAQARWAADDPMAANQPQDLTFSTVMPGGFDQMSCTLQRDPRRDWPDTEELSDLRVRDPGGEIIWEGRQQQLPDTGGSQAQLTPQGDGYQAHLDDDNSAAVIYIDQAQSNWQGPSLSRQKNLLAGNFSPSGPSVAIDPASNLPSLALEVDGAWAAPNIPDAEAWYDAGPAGLISVVFAVFDFNQNGDGNWHDVMGASADDVASSAQTAVLTLAGPTNEVFSVTTPSRYVFLGHYYNATPAGADGRAYIAYVRPAVVGNHGIPIQGSWPTGIGVAASDVVAYALTKWAPELTFTIGASGTIQQSQFIIPQLAFMDPTTVGAIVKQAVQYELLDWAVWENRTFYLNARGASVKTRNWRARVGPSQLQEAGPDITRLCNGVVVQFTGFDGITQTAGPPGSGAQTEDASLQDTDPSNPANQAGLRRWLPLQMGTTNPTTAVQAGAVFLKVMKETNTSGQASLEGHVQDDKGIWWPVSRVRAGDTITFTDARDPSPRRIVSTSYTHQNKTNAVQLDQPPDTMSAILADLSAVIAPFGLS